MTVIISGNHVTLTVEELVAFAQSLRTEAALNIIVEGGVVESGDLRLTTRLRSFDASERVVYYLRDHATAPTCGRCGQKMTPEEPNRLPSCPNCKRKHWAGLDSVE